MLAQECRDRFPGGGKPACAEWRPLDARRLQLLFGSDNDDVLGSTDDYIEGEVVAVAMLLLL